MKKQNFNIVIVLVVVAVVFGFLIFGQKVFTGSAVNDNQNTDNVDWELVEDISYDWLNENCGCVVRDRYYCYLEGFEWNESRGLCVNSAEKKVTTALIGCSVFNCSAGNYTYVAEGKWQRSQS